MITRFARTQFLSVVSVWARPRAYGLHLILFHCRTIRQQFNQATICLVFCWLVFFFLLEFAFAPFSYVSSTFTRIILFTSLSVQCEWTRSSNQIFIVIKFHFVIVYQSERDHLASAWFWLHVRRAQLYDLGQLFVCVYLIGPELAIVSLSLDVGAHAHVRKIH